MENQWPGVNIFSLFSLWSHNPTYGKSYGRGRGELHFPTYQILILQREYLLDNQLGEMKEDLQVQHFYILFIISIYFSYILKLFCGVYIVVDSAQCQLSFFCHAYVSHWQWNQIQVESSWRFYYLIREMQYLPGTWMSSCYIKEDSSPPWGSELSRHDELPHQLIIENISITGHSYVHCTTTTHPVDGRWKSKLHRE